MFGRLQKVSLACPVCGHEQEESQFARSTFCRDRGCSAHFRIEDGLAVPPDPAPAYPFPSRAELDRQMAASPFIPVLPPKKVPRPRPRQLELFSGGSRPAGSPSVIASSAPTPRVATSSGDHPAIARLARRLPSEPKAGHRHVHCLDCDFPQSISTSAISTMCLRCTAPIPLENYDIRQMHHRRIRTRGNVFIHRKGGINGVSVHCNDLTIEGEFTGSGIDCDGDLTIVRHGVISGLVRCRRLIVKGRAEVTFTHPVHARDVIIDGLVRGDIACEESLHLEKKSLLEGDIETRSLSVSEGARHSGKVRMPQLSERYARFGDFADLAGMELPGEPGPRMEQSAGQPPDPAQQESSEPSPTLAQVVSDELANSDS